MVDTEQDIKKFLKSWAWKREHRTDKARFKQPYLHTVNVNGETRQLIIKQAHFKEEGFASTVWDSSIVVAKYLERWPGIVTGKHCLDLSAGCGLIGIVLAKLGARSVVASDLGSNLALLQQNCSLNREPAIKVVEYEWGSAPPFDVRLDYIIGCDIMYIFEYVDLLLDSLVLLSHTNTQIILAYGRNRQAESMFLEKAETLFDVTDIPGSDLDATYQCSDVRVLKLSKRQSRSV